MPSPPLPPLIIPIAQPEFVKARMNENPLLKVPPASRGNRTGARLGSPREAGGTCRRGAIMNSGSVIGIRVQRFGTKSLKQGLFISSATVNGQARCIALTPFVPLSRLRARGIMECGSGASAYAEASLQHSKQVSAGLTPLPRCGRGAGGEGEKACAPCTQ